MQGSWPDTMLFSIMLYIKFCKCTYTKRACKGTRLDKPPWGTSLDKPPWGTSLDKPPWGTLLNIINQKYTKDRHSPARVGKFSFDLLAPLVPPGAFQAPLCRLLGLPIFSRVSQPFPSLQRGLYVTHFQCFIPVSPTQSLSVLSHSFRPATVHCFSC